MSDNKEKRIDPVEEIWKIRERNYERTKNMTAGERVAYINTKADKVLERMKTPEPRPELFQWLYSKNTEIKDAV